MEKYNNINFYDNEKNEEKQSNYYAIIPANVRYDKDLSDKAKLLYGEITALSNTTGYCYATNSYFADLYQITNRQITRLMTALEEKGYISIDRTSQQCKIYPFQR